MQFRYLFQLALFLRVNHHPYLRVFFSIRGESRVVIGVYAFSWHFESFLKLYTISWRVRGWYYPRAKIALKPDFAADHILPKSAPNLLCVFSCASRETV